MMSCTDCERVLEEYLDGELAAREAAEAEAHITSCGVCAGAYDALVSEQNLYSTYARPVEVSPRLWGGVEARISAKAAGGVAGLRRRVSAWLAPLLTAPRFSPALTAALVLVAIALTVGVMKLTGSRGQSQTAVALNDQLNVKPDAKPAPPSDADATTRPAQTSMPANGGESPSDEKGGKPESNNPAGPKPSPETRKGPANEQRRRVLPELNGGARVEQATNVVARPSQPTPEQLVAEAEQRYIAAINLLQRDVASRRTRIDAQTTARFDETLAAIDRSIAETRSAVRQHAGDPIAAQYMLSAYAKKVEVLREMAHLQQ